MKRVKKLLDAIADRDNLRQAYRAALRGKRQQPEARAFAADVEGALTLMSRQLHQGDIAVGQFTQFTIFDPKERLITAPCFRERVLHHAIMNVCEPHFDRWLIHDTYACRKGKGRIACLLRARDHATRLPWFLKFDVRRYFDSISHARLLAKLERRFGDRALLRLFERIIRGYSTREGQGLPIGSLMSQHFANYYLASLDTLIQRELRITGFVRYMDDCGLWHAEKEPLLDALQASEEHLRNQLGLEFKPFPYLNRTRHGMDFLGCRVFPHYLTLNRRSRVRYRKKMLRLVERYHAGQISEAELQERATALTAFTRTEGVCSGKFRQAVLGSLAESGQTAPNG